MSLGSQYVHNIFSYSRALFCPIAVWGHEERWLEKGSRNLQEGQPNIRTEGKVIFRISTQWKEWAEIVWSSKSSKHGHGAFLCYFDINNTGFIQNQTVVMHKLHHKLQAEKQTKEQPVLA